MNHHDTRIVTYLQRFPEVRNKYVAGIFNVEPSHVSRLRRQNGCLNGRQKAAEDRSMAPKDLDKAILAAVYKNGLVDMVLTK